MNCDPKFSVSPESMRCGSVVPSARCVSSRDIGWTSLLVDVHTGIAWNEAYTAVTTLDPRIGVSLSGHYVSHFYSRGVWRHDVFRPGTTTVLRTEDTRGFRFTPLKGNECEFALVYFPLEQLMATVDHLRRPGQALSVPSFNQSLAHDRTIAQVTRALISAMQEGAPELYAETASAWLAAHILTCKGTFARDEDNRSAGELSDSRLQRVIEFISARFSEQITLDQLATEAGISKFHFTRLFRAKVGETPHRFLSNVRLDAAQRMLITSNLPVGEIALLCGYSAASHFTGAFSKRYGTGPANFRAARGS